MASITKGQGGSSHPSSSLIGSGGGTSGISSTTHPTHSGAVIQNQGGIFKEI